MAAQRLEWAAAVLAAALLVLPGCQSTPSGGVSRLSAPEPIAEPTGSYLDLGRQYLAGGDLRLAKAAFIRSLRLEGWSAAALTGAGVTAERQGLLTEARRYFEMARDKAPDSVVARNNLGAVLYRLGEYDAAKQSFLAAFALSSGTSRVAHHNLGLTELAMREAASEEPPEARNPRPVRREGIGEYRLLADNKTEQGT